jgi:arylsulfatase
LEHNTPKTIEQLFANNDVELYDVRNDPLEIKNLALDIGKYGEVIAMLNTKMNRLIEEEVGEDIGQMLPSENGASWTLSTSIDDFRP